jgi:O-antigen/teichoic acid export membrane protein
VSSGFARAAILNSGTSLAASVLSLGNVLIIARGLDATGRGEIAFLTTIVVISSALGTLGIPQAASNFAGRRPELVRALSTNAVIASVLVGAVAIVVIALLVAAVPAIGGDGIPAHLRWAALLTIPVVILQMNFHALTVSQYGFRAMNLAYIVTPVLTVTANTAMLLAGELTVGRALGSWITGRIIATGILGWFVLKRIGGFGRPDRALGRRSVAFGLQAHAARVLNQGNYRLDQWIMGSLAGSQALGIYSVAVAWSEALFFLPASLALAQVPDVTRASPDEAGRQAASAFRIATLITVVLAIGMVLAAPLLTTVIFGDEFAPAAGQVRVLAFGAFGIVALKLLGTTLTAQGRPLLETAATAVTFVIVVGLDVLLIPDHEGMGAAIASLAAYTAGGLCIAVLFRRALGVGLRDLVPRGEELSAVRDRLRRTRQAPAAG